MQGKNQFDLERSAVKDWNMRSSISLAIIFMSFSQIILQMSIR